MGSQVGPGLSREYGSSFVRSWVSLETSSARKPKSKALIGICLSPSWLSGLHGKAQSGKRKQELITQEAERMKECI